jgi:hypothetical protein
LNDKPLSSKSTFLPFFKLKTPLLTSDTANSCLYQPLLPTCFPPKQPKVNAQQLIEEPSGADPDISAQVATHKKPITCLALVRFCRLQKMTHWKLGSVEIVALSCLFFGRYLAREFARFRNF